MYLGWQTHWFLTDDAFIAFRFIDNRQRGFGYTWNPPPFLPVEGYTSFSWVLLLDAIWSVFGIEPPEIANDVSLVCAFGTLGLTSWASHRLCARRGVSTGGAVAATAAVLLATVSNRTVLVWASGGLETALFNVLLQSWILVGLLGSARDLLRPRTLALLCALASAIELTRPEGLLPVACSVAIVSVCWVLGVVRFRTAVGCLSPLLLVAAHLAWRHSFYGEWLPNTYYAKVVEPWPEAGARYLAAFGLEYAYYLAVPVWSIATWSWARDSVRETLAAAGGEARRRAFARFLVRAGVLATLLAMLGFGVVIAGGDHFEYRALSFLCPLLVLAMLYGCLAIEGKTNTRTNAGVISTVVIAGFAAISGVLPWTIFAQTNHTYSWSTTPTVIPIAAAAPAFLRPVASTFDNLETWLIPHGVGLRHYEHRAFWLHQVRSAPTRTRGDKVCAAADHPVGAIGTIGVVSWVLPSCAILDMRGLCDYVIARTPSHVGYLGHDRKAPEGYMQQFQPNVTIEGGDVRIRPRPRPLTDQQIRDVEQYYRGLVRELF